MGKSVVPGGLFQYGGMPVGGQVYNGMWGNKVWFVDYDYGTAGAPGDAPDAAEKYLDTIIAKASAWDTIYVRPRIVDYSGGDPQSMVPSTTTANCISTSAQYGLSIIGTGTGYNARCLGSITTLAGASGIATTPVLTMAGPYSTVENIHFKKGGMTGKPELLVTGFSSSVVGCRFNQGNGAGHGYGALTIDVAPYVYVGRNWFDRCTIGVSINPTSADPYGICIENNEFNYETATCRADIMSLSGSAQGNTRLIIRQNVFSHEIPNVSPARYIYIQDSGGGTSTGVVAGNYFGTATLVTATIMTLRGLLDSGNMCAKGFLTS